MDPKDKPILDTDGQIAHLQAKGVKFEKMSVEDAKQYLTKNNNYFKLRAYRKNFPKHPGGDFEGQYIDLDFAMLKDLAIIDMRLRYVLIHLALDIEHFAKVKLLKAIEASGNDGYQIVVDYMASLQKKDEEENKNRLGILQNELNRNRGNPYCGGIIAKYDGCYPAWAFVEIIPFGSFIHFYGFCADQLDREDLKDGFYLLIAVKALRNAAAHNNCIIHDMGVKDSSHKTNYKIQRALNRISKETKRNQLSNARMQQMITLLYAHSVIVTSEGVHDFEKQALTELCERMFRHIDYYTGNDSIVTSFSFFKKAVDILFP